MIEPTAKRKRGRPRINPPREKKSRGGQVTTGRSKGPRVMIRFSDDEHQQIAALAGGAQHVAAFLRAKGLGRPWPMTK